MDIDGNTCTDINSAIVDSRGRKSVQAEIELINEICSWQKIFWGRHNKWPKWTFWHYEGYSAQQLKALPRDSYTNRNGVYVIGLKEYIERLRDEKNALLDKGKNLRNVDVSRNSDIVSDKNLQRGQKL